MKKIITVIMLVIAITLCGACTLPQEFDDLKTQTAALERLVDELQNKQNGNEQNEAIMQEKIEELQDKLDYNEQDKVLMQEQIDEQQKKIDLYEKRIRNLSGTPIKFTEKEPIYGSLKNADEYIVFQNEGTAYQEFCDYYKENHPYEDKNVFMFRHKGNDGLKLYDEYYVVSRKNGEVLISQYIEFCDEIFGEHNKNEYRLPPPGTLVSMEGMGLQFYWAPTYFDIKNNYITIEFGRDEVTNEYEHIGVVIFFVEYFNIYYADECIGTCYYYNENCYLSHTGVLEYLVNRLITIEGTEE